MLLMAGSMVSKAPCPFNTLKRYTDLTPLSLRLASDRTAEAMVSWSLPVAKSVLAARGFLNAHTRSMPCFLSKLLASIRAAVV